MGRNIIKYLLPTFLVFVIISANSCTSECLENQNSIGLAGFYSENKSSISIDSITIFGVGAPGDSMILKNGQNVKQVYLPMRVNATSVQYVFHYEQKAISSIYLNDTLTLNYEPIKYFASAECGAMFYYKINDFEYTEHIIDSIAIPSMEITNIDSETIKIFVKTNISE